MSIRHRIKASRISNAGQVCNCVERVYVQAAIADVFIDRITKAMQNVKMGNGMDDPEMGPLISGDALDAVHARVQRAVADGAVAAMALRETWTTRLSGRADPRLTAQGGSSMEAHEGPDACLLTLLCPPAAGTAL